MAVVNHQGHTVPRGAVADYSEVVASDYQAQKKKGQYGQ